MNITQAGLYNLAWRLNVRISWDEAGRLSKALNHRETQHKAKTKTEYTTHHGEAVGMTSVIPSDIQP